ncbi:MAG: exodeoxyribonuclease V subunit gamma [Deltaproteobacteria bacterium]|nr:exodeoxyribonuclease V subunit gamma [Deltaproteobacteria bacterium]
MAFLRLYTGNRLEILVEALADVLRKPLSSPLAKEIIVVQSKGMERWVSMELARRHGVCANCSFPFPNRFVYDISRRVVPSLPERSPFDPRVMRWKIMKLLPSCITRDGFESLRSYLEGGREDLKRFQLSVQIADMFDQYLLFRPEMILGWEKGREDHWQAVLWRELAKGEEDRHRAAIGEALFSALERPSLEIEGLPERVSVFGISALPRFHMQVFAAISRFSEVNLFLMNPCGEYWGDILSDREMRKTTGRQAGRGLSRDDLHLERGNGLLASMGRQGRDFFDLVTGFDCDEIRAFVDPGEGDLLSCIQSDILNLRDRNGAREGKKRIAESDRSIQIHSCHSPMREIEVLHDSLLDLFEKDPTLMPRDILVMTPDIESYAPYIQAVFDRRRDDPRWIPFSIADRSIRKESGIVETFLAILELWGGRFGVSQVLALLETQAVQRRFGLSERDLDLILRWVDETRIRWGIDGKSRSELGLPEFQENTWRAGLDRLLLGYAMPGGEEKMFRGVLPYDHVEGSETSVLGAFVHFAEELFSHTRSLGRPQTLDEWAVTLREVLDAFFQPDDEAEREVQAIRAALAELSAMGGVFDQEIGINVIKWHLETQLQGEGFGFGFITGRTTFCAMLPMRSIPFRVICLVGMNGDAYPRQSRPLGFDLMAKDPRPGDRSLRDEDRYLFLEAILSARERLYISYVGQSIQDNSLRPPSVLVSELVDYVEQGFEIPGKTMVDHLVTKHRLQAFSPEYFKKDGRLFSYSKESLQAARALQEAGEAVPFISKGLAEPEEEWKTLEVGDLCGFLANPARFLLNRRLGVYLEQEAQVLAERESFELKGLERYLLEQDLVERGFAGRDLGDFLQPVKASGRLPHGTAGECLYERLSQGVQAFVEKTRDCLRDRTPEPVEVDLRVSGFRLTGRIDNIYGGRLVEYRYARVRPKDRLKIWVYHLVLNSAGAAGCPRTSILVGLDRQRGKDPVWAAWEYSPVENSREILGKLLGRYWEGLTRPLCFFPESSWLYADGVKRRGRSQAESLQKARRQWTGSDWVRGEKEDPYYRLCFSGVDPLEAAFCEIALEVFEPLLEHEADRRDGRI